MKATDRTVLIAVGVAALALVFWLLILSPKRKEASELGAQVTDLKASIAEQDEIAAFGEQARSEFPRDYGRLVVLGKAVPSDGDTASLIVELNRLASSTGVQFRSIELGDASGTAVAPTPAPVPTDPAATGTAPAEGTSTDTTSSTSTTTDPSAAPAATDPSATSTSTTTTATGVPAVPTEATASTLPIGATVGAAGLPTLPYKLRFRGDFFQIADFMRDVDSLIKTHGGNVRADGRLFTIDGFSLAADQFSGFPTLSAWLYVTTYVTPEEQGLLNGASPSGPAAPVTPTTEVPSTPASAEVTVTG